MAEVGCLQEKDKRGEKYPLGEYMQACSHNNWSNTTGAYILFYSSLGLCKKKFGGKIFVVCKTLFVCLEIHENFTPQKFPTLYGIIGAVIM